MKPWLRIAWMAGLLAIQVSCSSMKDYQGHTVFNPFFLFYLESSSRDEWQMPGRVLEALQISEGEVVADIGAGGGYFTEKLANKVGPSGRVYATDVQDIMIRKLKKRVARHGLTNVSVIHAEFDNPCLPPASCDLVFFSSVYKEIDSRPAYMKKLREALKDGGQVAILEYRPDEDSPGPPKKYRLTESQVLAEMQEAGFELVDSHSFLPREYFLVFEVCRSDR